MKDLPVFTTDNGVASLILREIPYLRAAYVRLQKARDYGALAGECRDFCVACGAERVYATGHSVLERNEFHTAIRRMTCPAAALADTDAALWPVGEQTLAVWRQIYNKKVAKVPNGAWMTLEDGREMLKKGDGYFVHRGETLLGIGRASHDTIAWVAAVQPGAGRDVVLALVHALTEQMLTLTVASTNRKAVSLYESLGFVTTAELSRWYRLR